MEIDLRTLRHILALGRHRHYGRAATALNLSQPALSRSIAAAENTLGVRLFERDRRGVRPTAFGEVVLARGEALVGEVADLHAEIARLRGLEAGILRVGAGLYPAEISVATAMGRLHARHPGIRMDLLSDLWRDVATAVADGRLDLAIVELSSVEGRTSIEIEPLPSHPGLIVCRAGHPLLGRRRVSLEEILDFPLVGTKLPARVGSHLARASRIPLVDDIGDYMPAFHVESVAPSKQILANSDAVALLPAPLVAAELAQGSLGALDFRAPWLRTNYGFAIPRDRPLTPPVLALMAEIRKVEAEVHAKDGRRKRQSAQD